MTITTDDFPFLRCLHALVGQDVMISFYAFRNNVEGNFTRLAMDLEDGENNGAIVYIDDVGYDFHGLESIRVRNINPQAIGSDENEEIVKEFESKHQIDEENPFWKAARRATERMKDEA